LAAGLSLTLVVEGLLRVPIRGSIPRFLAGAALHVFTFSSLGIALGTRAGSLPQFVLFMVLVILSLQMLSGAVTPRDSMPEAVQAVMLAAPTTHFVAPAQAILYRGAGLAMVWQHFALLTAIGAALFLFALARFRSSISTMA
jgi:ABC-2 type transport system permease protein